MGAELSHINPDIVVTFGATAKDYINAIPKLQNRKVINLLDPSQTNWDHLKQWIFEQAYHKTNSYKVNWDSYANQFKPRGNMFDKNTNINMPDLIADITGEMVYRIAQTIP